MNKKLLITVTTVLIIVFTLFYLSIPSNSSVKTNITNTFFVKNPTVLQVENLPKPVDFIGLQNELQAFLATKNGTWSYSLYYNGTTIGINENAIYTAASTTKVLTALFVLSKVESGEIPNTALINDNLFAMINVSDNNSWYYLNSLVGYNNINNYAKQIGLKNTNFLNNTTTSSDLLYLIKAIDNEALVSDKNKTLLFNLMTNTETENRIPAGTPNSLVIHKTGTLSGNVHDFGKVVIGDNHYYLAIMGCCVSDEFGAKTISELSNITYNYLTLKY